MTSQHTLSLSRPHIHTHSPHRLPRLDAGAAGVTGPRRPPAAPAFFSFFTPFFSFFPASHTVASPASRATCSTLRPSPAAAFSAAAASASAGDSPAVPGVGRDAADAALRPRLAGGVAGSALTLLALSAASRRASRAAFRSPFCLHLGDAPGDQGRPQLRDGQVGQAGRQRGRGPPHQRRRCLRRAPRRKQAGRGLRGGRGGFAAARPVRGRLACLARVRGAGVDGPGHHPAPAHRAAWAVVHHAAGGWVGQGRAEGLGDRHDGPRLEAGPHLAHRLRPDQLELVLRDRPRGRVRVDARKVEDFGPVNVADARQGLLPHQLVPDGPF